MSKDLPVKIFQILVCTWWYWVSRGQFLLVLGGTVSVLGGTDWYLVALGQIEVELLLKGSSKNF